MKFYLEELEKVYEEVKATSEGLTEKEANERLEKNGKNKLDEGKKVTTFQRFMKELSNPMIIVLLVAALISGITAVYANESFADVIIILIVVLINAILGVYQESKAEKAIEALNAMTKSTSKVLRDGEMKIINSEDIVVGDIVLLEAGDAVPADGRLIESASLKIEEAALTGESVPVNKIIDILNLNGKKDITLGDRKNMIYMGSSTVYGRGKAIITATGMDTEMGKIADTLANTVDNTTPLQLKLNQLSGILSKLVIGVCVFIFLFSLIKSGNFSGEVVLSTFMVAVSLAVAAIPEGLATVVTIVLSIGVTSMSRKKAVIRKLTAVETLGCAQIICSDKTGTLTQNKMTVVENYGCDEKFVATGMALCCDAELSSDNVAVGEPTECALVNHAFKIGISKNNLKYEMPRIGEAPFDSMRKMMSTVHKKEDGKIVQFTKGAPDEILKCCTRYSENNEEKEMTEEKRQEILKCNKDMADKALRVLCVAYRDYNNEPNSYEAQDLEKDLVYMGLVGMIDPVRPEVIDSIKECKTAGIKPIMITGDHRDTAMAIAKELGIIENESEVITGSELNDISEDDLNRDIDKYSVYARVQPEHKVRIVKAWKNRGKVTAMTGDGVNDAPSIKSADIGVGMGITGTDVTKNVADMVLADDNFATIVTAVGEGRKIYDNIRKAIQFLLASNLSEVVSIFTATLLGFTILKPVHILWINLITDCFPALALGMEKGEKDIMQRPPRDSKEGIFAGGLGFDVGYQGFMIAVVVLVAYFVGHYIESGTFEIAQSADGITMAFLTMSMAEIFHSFNVRSQRKSLFSLKNHNGFLWGAGILSLLLSTLVIYVPFLSNMFGFEHISLVEYGIALLLALSVIPIVEIVKAIQRMNNSRKGN